MYARVSKAREIEVAGEILPLLKSLIPLDVLEYWVENPQSLRSIIQDKLYAEQHSTMLRRLYLESEIVVSTADAPCCIFEAAGVFAGTIDSSFSSETCPAPTASATMTTVEVYEQLGNGRFADLFGAIREPQQLTLTEQQIVAFCASHKDKLHPLHSNTFFLTEEAAALAVVAVTEEQGVLSVERYAYDADTEWCSGPRMRLVVKR